MDKNSLRLDEKLLKELSSPLKSERQNAIEEFVNENYDPQVLLEYLSTDNDNLISSYIQVSSRGNINDKIKCWEFFEQHYFLHFDYFTRRTRKANHIIRSMHKYFINNENIDIFILHLRDINSIIIQTREKLIRYTNQNKNEIILSRVHLTMERECNWKYEEIAGMITEKEIEIAKRISYIYLDNDMKQYGDENDIKLIDYFYLLKDDFLYYFYSSVTDQVFLHTFLDQNIIEDLIGIDETHKRNITNGINSFLDSLQPDIKMQQLIDAYLVSEGLANRLDELLQVLYFNNRNKNSKIHFIYDEFIRLREEFKSQFLFTEREPTINERIVVKNIGRLDNRGKLAFSNENWIETEKNEELDSLLTKYFWLVRALFPFWIHPIYEYFRKSKDFYVQNEVFDLLTQMENLYINNDTSWEQEDRKLRLWLFLKQEDVLIEDCSEFGLKYIDDLSILWEIINRNSNWYCETSNNVFQYFRAFLSLELLLKSGDTDAYLLAKKVYFYSKANPIKLRVNNLFEYCFKSFFNAIGGSRRKREELFGVGNKWEKICNKIAINKFKRILVDDNNETRLVNNLIPDIVVNKSIKYSGELIQSAETIIECKKTLYFANVNWGNNIDIINNEIVQSYLPYCNELQLWIFEKNEVFDSCSTHERVKYFFAEDFLNDDFIDKIIKDEIIKLIEYSKKVENKIIKFNNVEEIIYDIEKYFNL